MRPVMQTRFGGPSAPVEEQGNCFAACLASLLGLPLAEVEGYQSGLDTTEAVEARWWGQLQGWLKARGLIALQLAFANGETPEQFTYGRPELRYIANGKSPRGEWDHSVVFCDGELEHDPHPSGSGLEGSPSSFTLIVPLL